MRKLPTCVKYILAISVSFLMSHAASAAGATISAVSPATATVGTPVTFTATVSAPSGIKSCTLSVDLADVGSMNVYGNTASLAYTFTAGGSRIAFVYCHDNAGGISSGPNTAVWVTGQIITQPPLNPGQETTPETPSTPSSPAAATTTAMARTLVKLVCPEGAASDDPCKAVYYVGADGKRHAFPNEKAYFTWYQDFSGVNEISASELAAIPLGNNITYRPGVRMVKFTTLNKVYAVGPGGVLRWIASEDVARALYGDNWNQQIDDIADPFYVNYTFGSDVNTAADFNPTSVKAQAATFD